MKLSQVVVVLPYHIYYRREAEARLTVHRILASVAYKSVISTSEKRTIKLVSQLRGWRTAQWGPLYSILRARGSSSG